MPKMTDDMLSAIVEAKVASAVGHMGGTISDERRKALRYYRGEPFGNEVEDRSQVVSHDVAEAIESIMPSLIEIFAAGDKVVRFEPTGAEDEESADQATDYVNWIWNSQNDGFGNFYTWFKDALLQKVGVVKIWWDTEVETVRETYTGLSQEEIAALNDDEDVEIVAVVPHAG